ncbi:MAG: D-2-hydroxyacid dehydrogenase family protein [Candidatus Binatia bacterium]
MANETQDRPRVVVLDDYEGLAAEAPAFKELAARGRVTVLRTRLANDEELSRALGDAQCILLVRERTRLNAQQLGLAPRLRMISQTGVTVGHFDFAEATRRGIVVTGTRGDNSVSTVELTLALMLAVARKIPLVDRRMRQEAWPPMPGQLLHNKTLGVVGLGRIGKEVARLAQAFGMRVIACGKTLNDERARAAGAERVSLENLLRQSDIVTIHVKLSQGTRDLIGEKELALMKPGAFLVNTSRGPIVSEAALVRALREGRLGGAALDVYDQEPLPLEHPLRGFDNAVLLPHRGYATVEVLVERFDLAMRNIINFLDENPTEVLNPEVLGGKK